MTDLLRIVARAVAALAVLYAVAFGAYIVWATQGAGDDPWTIVRTGFVIPWCGIPFVMIARGKRSWPWITAAVALPTFQTVLLLPPYGFGMFYAPIALAGIIVASLAVAALSLSKRRGAGAATPTSP
jgi:hypothetical protein